MFHAPFDEGLRLLIISLLATVERHPEGSDEPWISSMVRVARVPPDPFGSVGECGLDLSGAAEDSAIIRFVNSKRIGNAEYACVDGRVVALNALQKTNMLIVPMLTNEYSPRILTMV